MKALCPKAWLINFANPSGMVTEAIIRYGKWVKVVGLCNVLVMVKMGESEILGVFKEDLIYKFAGVNHFHWHKKKKKNGEDITLDLIDKLYEENSGLPKNIFDVAFYK